MKIDTRYYTEGGKLMKEVILDKGLSRIAYRFEVGNGPELVRELTEQTRNGKSGLDFLELGFLAVEMGVNPFERLHRA